MAICWKYQRSLCSINLLKMWVKQNLLSKRTISNVIYGHPSQVIDTAIHVRFSETHMVTSTMSNNLKRRRFERHSFLQNQSSIHFLSCTTISQASQKRLHGRSQSATEEDEEDSLFKDQTFKEVFEDHYLLPASGHRVYVIQPDVRSRQDKDNRGQLKLDEACALIDSLPGWSVVDKKVFKTKAVDHRYIFGKGKFAAISATVRATPGITAVFVSINLLSPLQLSALQSAWNMPVYDRYTVVLQIFRTRARTAEAKLQVTLAEIPYLRSRLRGMHSGRLDQQTGGMAYIGGAGETFLEIRQRLLQERELKCRKALNKIRSQRDLLRKERTKREIPVVAVVGYTNAGKTSLIKALTGEKRMVPRDQLFATLDVTAHAGLLGNHLKVLYTDTVGFISDIPTDLVHSFSATLDDVKRADVIVHVRDISHPDCQSQKLHVLKTLKELDISQKLQDSILEVCNKVDLLPEAERLNDNLLISTVTGEGLGQLQMKLSDAVLRNTERDKVRVKVPMSGQHVSWLYKETTVVESVADDSGKYLIMDVLMTQSAHAKFLAKFGKGKRKES